MASSRAGDATNPSIRCFAGRGSGKQHEPLEEVLRIERLTLNEVKGAAREQGTRGARSTGWSAFPGPYLCPGLVPVNLLG
jgi:hypothetical protein